MAKSLLCRVGVHQNGETYIVCRRCGKEGDKIYLTDYGDSGGGPIG